MFVDRLRKGLHNFSANLNMLAGNAGKERCSNEVHWYAIQVVRACGLLYYIKIKVHAPYIV